MIDHTNLEDYNDPIIYDAENAENAQFQTDGPFYLALARQVGGPVLELGCGTGRVTLLLGQQGIDITGLDIVPEMLERARQKAAGLPIRWLEGDVRTFQLEAQFSLIYTTGGVFNLLLTRSDQEAMLARIREHLLPEGIFALDVVIPQPGWMHSNEQEEPWDTYITEDGREIHLSGTDRYDPIAQIRHEIAYRRWRAAGDENGQMATKAARFATRYIFPQEMATLLHYNGFAIQHRYADGTFESPTVESRNIFYVCRLID